MKKTFTTQIKYGYTFNFLALPGTNFFKFEVVSKIGANIERTIELEEDRNLYGIAHFIEHLSFRAPRDYTSDDLLATLLRQGSYNASTTHDRINYWVKTTMANKEGAINLVSNIVFNELEYISREEFELEKNVVMNEARLYKDDEHTMFHFNTPSTICGMHKEDNIIGEADTIATFTLEDVIDVKARLMAYGHNIINVTYDPESGSEDEIIEMINKEFSTFPKYSGGEEDLERNEPEFDKAFNMDNDSERYLINILFDIPATVQTTSRGNGYLSAMAETSLTNVIREKHGLTYHVQMSTSMIWGKIYTTFSTDVTPGTEDQLMKLFEESIIESVDNFTEEKFNDYTETLDLKRVMADMNLENYDGLFWQVMWGDGLRNDLYKTDLVKALAEDRDKFGTYEAMAEYLKAVKKAVVNKTWSKVVNKA